MSEPDLRTARVVWGDYVFDLVGIEIDYSGAETPYISLDGYVTRLERRDDSPDRTTDRTEERA